MGVKKQTVKLFGYVHGEYKREQKAMKWDCHMHMVLDGQDWKKAIARHEKQPELVWIRQQLECYQKKGVVYLRDGGDRWGVGAAARDLAEEYGIRYRTPLAPLCKKGHYGGFIGWLYNDRREYQAQVKKIRELGGDFIKIMISGLMDFDRYGVLSEPGLEAEEIRDLVNIAHDAGFSVMAHGNGARVVEAAAEAGVDSIEHGAYLEEAALAAMQENGTVWVPTLSAVGNLRGTGRFREDAVERILASALENVERFGAMGGLIAPGTDAGAWAVPHGSGTDFAVMEKALGEKTAAVLETGARAIMGKF